MTAISSPLVTRTCQRVRSFAFARRSFTGSIFPPPYRPVPRTLLGLGFLRSHHHFVSKLATTRKTTEGRDPRFRDRFHNLHRYWLIQILSTTRSPKDPDGPFTRSVSRVGCQHLKWKAPEAGRIPCVFLYKVFHPCVKDVKNAS